MKNLAMIACLSALPGCASFPPLMAKPAPVVVRSSYAAPGIAGQEAEKVARDITRFLSNEFLYAKTTIRLDDTGVGFGDALAHSLALQGFGVTMNDQVADAVVLHYAITTLDTMGVIARFRFQGKEASKFYPRTAQGLKFDNVYTVRGVTK
jgi:hypothetical protein